MDSTVAMQNLAEKAKVDGEAEAVTSLISVHWSFADARLLTPIGMRLSVSDVFCVLKLMFLIS
jgi:hypothetical protein